MRNTNDKSEFSRFAFFQFLSMFKVNHIYKFWTSNFCIFLVTIDETPVRRVRKVGFRSENLLNEDYDRSKFLVYIIISHNLKNILNIFLTIGFFFLQVDTIIYFLLNTLLNQFMDPLSFIIYYFKMFGPLVKYLSGKIVR